MPSLGPLYEENPFHWGLLALFGKSKLLTRDERRLFAAEMLYAHRHDVPPEYLLGFVYQVGKQAENMYEKVRSDKREPWFDQQTNVGAGARRESVDRWGDEAEQY